MGATSSLGFFVLAIQAEDTERCGTPTLPHSLNMSMCHIVLSTLSSVLVIRTTFTTRTEFSCTQCPIVLSAGNKNYVYNQDRVLLFSVLAKRIRLQPGQSSPVLSDPSSSVLVIRTTFTTGTEFSCTQCPIVLSAGNKNYVYNQDRVLLYSVSHCPQCW